MVEAGRPAAASKLVGLRIDVDTFDGTRDGVPRLLDVLRDAGMRGTFYFSLGPDNAGRAIFNALRPGFLTKMFRTRAASVYGWRTVLSGTLLPARMIGAAFPHVVRRAAREGHEIGVHAWDHRFWQDRLLRLSPERIRTELDRGRAAFQAAAGEPARTFAAPAWLSCDAALLHEETFDLSYASDCRGTEPFLPVVAGRVLRTPQIPSTLPTLDEAVGTTHDAAPAYFADMLATVRGATWSVLTVHAELEGGPYAADFAQFLANARASGIECVALGRLLEARRAAGPLPERAVAHREIPGRHGVVAMQIA